MSFEVNRRLVAKRSPLETDAVVDSVTAGIIRGAFETFCFETAIHLGRSASSAIINQSNERNASIIDAHGRLAGISVGIPQLLFISPLAVRWGLEHFEEDDWGPGDVFVGNDPDHGGGHLPDYTVYSPCFDADEKLALALVRLLEILGEAAKGVSPDFRDAHPQIPWKLVAGARDRLIHGYFEVDLKIVWEIVTRDLPPLIAELERLLSRNGN